jgi:hypothetical protein
VNDVFSGGSPVSLDTLRQAAKAGEDGSKSQLRKSFYTSMPSECLDDMERSMVKSMGLDFDSSKEHYHVKVWSSNAPVQCELQFVFASDEYMGLMACNFVIGV